MDKKDFIKINDYLWEIPKSFRSNMRVPARIYASEKILEHILKDKSIEQLIWGAGLKGIIRYAIAMPDCHQGYDVPIGFVGAIKIPDGVISPGACGFDINCGMRLLKSEYKKEELSSYLNKLALEMQNQVPSGLGKGRQTKLSIKQIDKILEHGTHVLLEQGYGEKQDVENCEASGKLDWAEASTVSEHAKNRGRDQVGTLGSGNHFCEIQKVEEIFDKQGAKLLGLFQDQVVVMIHTGSRGLGHQVCSDYLKKGKYFPFDSSAGQKYFSAMAGAANYAWANRYMIAHYIRDAWAQVLGKGAKLQLLYDVAHNIIKKEKYKEGEAIVHRKGATRAFPGQPVLIPGSMGTASYVLVGAQSGEGAFYSTAHGAGRTMSRRQAMRTISGKEVIKELSSKGIVVKCRSMSGIAEEAPQAYKNIDDIVDVVHNVGLSKKVAKLIPLAVIKGE